MRRKTIRSPILLRRNIWRLALTALFILSCRTLSGSLPGIGQLYGSGNIVTENRSVDDFDRLSIRGTGIVHLSQGAQPSLSISADDNLIQYISTTVQGRTLVFDLTDDGRSQNLDPSRPFEFDLVVVNIEGIQISGSADVRGTSLATGVLDLAIDGSGDIRFETLTTSNLDLSIDGSGDVQIKSGATGDLSIRIGGSGDIEMADLTADLIEVDIFGSGNLELSGVAADQQIRIVGSGDYRAKELACERVEVRISGSGTATVWALEKLDVSIPGSGDVRYYGAPLISQAITGSGDLRSMGEP